MARGTPAMSESKRLTIVGAGLAGALLATLLARRGWEIDVFERRGDPRIAGYAGGRSIDLALAERGLHGLRIAGAAEAVLAKAVMMRGRMVHFLDGSQQLQRYGRDDSEVIWSVSRGESNITLLQAAEAAGARLHFDHRLQSVDFDGRTARFVDDRDGTLHAHAFTALIGADGAAPHCGRDSGGMSISANGWNPSAMATRNWKSRPRPMAGSASNQTHCTSGRAAATCASPCPTTSARSPSRCSSRPMPTNQDNRDSTRWSPGPMRGRCSNATSPMRLR